MSTLSPRKSTRAAATRRKAPVVDFSDDEENIAPRGRQDSEDFEPEAAPQKKPVARRGRPKKSAEESIPATPKPAARRRTARTESIEPMQQFTPPETTQEPPSPEKRSSTRKTSRISSIRSARKSRASIVSVAESVVNEEEEPSQLLTPKASASPEVTSITPRRPVSPEASNATPTPLADITESTLNETTPVPEIPESQTQLPAPGPATVEKDTLHETVMERPHDILVRKRAAAIPIVTEPAEPKPRLVITYLYLTNFKSYAGVQKVGPFHASFSSVVGPNGSGKSNVIDSLLFVFGFRASKMRQGKLSALIHNSANNSNLEYCEVAVHFQEVMDLPTGGSQVIPDSTLVISRKAFRNNSSAYYINDKTSNFTTVTTLLKDRGIDLDHKRFLILQGEVESIAQMKPKAANEHDDGLLEYLEDIIGTSKYKTPIEDSAAKTEEFNEVCLEKSNRVQLVEKEKSGLEDKKNKALTYLRHENELAAKRATLYQLFISEFDDHIQVNQESVNQLQGDLDEELQKHAGNEQGIKELEQQYKKGSKAYETLEKQTQEVFKEMAKIDKETVKFEEKKKFLANKQKKLEKTKETAKFGISQSDTLAKQYADDVERYADEIEELEKKMKAEEKELESVRIALAGKTQGLSDDIAAKQKSLEPWSAKINDKQSAIAVAQSELDILREKENAGAVAIAEAEAKIAGFEESKQTKAAELQECKAEKKRLEKQVQKVQSQLDDLAQKEPGFKTKLSDAQQKAVEARASLSATQTQGKVLENLTRLKESGRISGFHGRLGNLGAIDQKYDTAISTACPGLNNLVVDTVEVAQQCIEYLRKNDLGRANFIVLDRLAKRDLSPIDTPENVPRLLDLVKPKHDMFKPAFFSVLQNTLVAKDLQHANRIAYGAQRWRVVTLDGQLIDKSGTMSGGGSRPAKGGMSSKLVADVSKDQVVKMEQDRDTLQESFDKLQKQQRIFDNELRDLQKQIPQLETKAQKIALELESFDRNIADSGRRIKELSTEQTSSKADKSRITALEKTIAATEKDVSKLRAETADVEAEIKALQDKIMEIGGVKLRSQKAKVDGLKEQIDTLNDASSNAEISRSKEEKQRNKHEKAFADAEKELEKVAVEAEKAETDMDTHKANAAGTRQQAEKAQETLDSRKEELQTLKKDLNNQQTELNETRKVEIEMRNKLEEGQKALVDYQRKQAHFQAELNKLSYQNLSEFGEEQDAEGLPTYTKDELQDIDKHSLKDEIAGLEKKNENTNVDLTVLAEYKRRVDEHKARSLDLAEAISQRDLAKKRCDELKRLRLEGFMEGFSAISLKLKEMYQMITMGGNAELELVDSLDPFSEGILFSVMPPKKSWKNISNLSGGEKTLSSLALVFALHHYKPTPLYVMDEIDAALDFRNVSIVAAYIKERTKNAQFIVISLRNNMFELASRLVGVYKVNHMTKSVTIENKDYLVQRA
ncbi:nuclear condensin-like protein complex subunit Smc4 [Lophiotrema nucula]|uniref:Structural maintenance of chromosomes protein n=1 Tax=Lophiotrema nucula TaxID=690887 RepID=A0A6A5ZU00_9PLEO|nr:nuclear condensin-like protein complex subunit Smc4 [Lophiotrema nucula]